MFLGDDVYLASLSSTASMTESNAACAMDEGVSDILIKKIDGFARDDLCAVWLNRHGTEGDLIGISKGGSIGRLHALSKTSKFN